MSYRPLTSMQSSDVTMVFLHIVQPEIFGVSKFDSYFSISYYFRENLMCSIQLRRGIFSLGLFRRILSTRAPATRNHSNLKALGPRNHSRLGLSVPSVNRCQLRGNACVVRKTRIDAFLH